MRLDCSSTAATWALMVSVRPTMRASRNPRTPAAADNRQLDEPFAALSSYIDELLDERTAVMEMEMVIGLPPEVPANPNICPFTPELGARRRVTGKGGESTAFI
jgi:hypothetical protein